MVPRALARVAAGPTLLVAAQAVCVAVLFGLNHVVGLIDSGNDYTPFAASTKVSAQVFDETARYAPGARRFMRTGRVVSGDLKEATGFDSVQTIAPVVVVGGLGWILGSLEWAWMLLNALLPAVIWLLVFRLARPLVSSRVLRALVAWATILVPFGFRQIFLVGPDSLTQPLELARLPHPALSFGLFLCTVLAVAEAVRRGGARRCIAAGLLAGGLVYVYYFYFVSASVGLGITFAVALGLRQRGLVNRLLAIGVPAAAVSLPYVVLVATASQRRLLERMGEYTHHTPSRYLVAMLVLVGLAAGYHLSRRRALAAEAGPGQWLTLVLLAALAGASVGLNLQVLTGYDAENGHFLLRVLKPLAFLIAALLVAGRLQRFAGQRWLRAGAVVAIAALAGLGVVRQVEVARRTLADHRTSDPRASVAIWLRGHAPADAVVGTTDGQLITEIAAESGNPLLAPDGTRTKAANAEILRRYLVTAKLAGLSLPEVERALRGTGGTPTPEWSEVSWILFLGRYDHATLVADAARLWPTVDPRQALKAWALDFMVVREPGVPAPLRAVAPDARPVFSAGPWTLVQLRPGTA